MSCIPIDIGGRTFGELTAIKHTYKRIAHRGSTWLCQCSCGRKIRVCTRELRAGRKLNCNGKVGSQRNHRSCGVCAVKIQQMYKDRNLCPACSRASHLWSEAKHRAKQFKLPFSITIQDVLQVWPADNRCPVFPEIELTQNLGKKGPCANSPTLDRRIPMGGYVRGNIVVMSYHANVMKHNETEPAMFYRLGDWMAKNA